MIDLTDGEFRASIVATERLLADTEVLIADLDGFLANLKVDSLRFQRNQIEAFL